MSYYVSPVKKQKSKITLSVGRDDKRRKFHILFKAQGIEIPIPRPLPGRIEEVGFNFACGIKANTIIETYKEVLSLLDKGYVEEELKGAPPGI